MVEGYSGRQVGIKEPPLRAAKATTQVQHDFVIKIQAAKGKHKRPCDD